MGRDDSESCWRDPLHHQLRERPLSFADPDPCDSLIPAAIGGPLLPKTSEIAVFRWLANANYEIDYRGQVFLFDTYYNRKARNRPLGFSAEEGKRASVIFLGHGH